MKYSIIVTTAIALTFANQLVFAGSITDTYSAGDTLTATKMDNIKTAVNGNASDISSHSGDASAHHSRYTDNEAQEAIMSNTNVVTYDSSGNVDISGVITFATPHPSFIQINATDFHPSSANIYNPFIIGRDYFNGVFKLAGETNEVYAAVKLPHNSTITSFSCIFDDNSSVGDPQTVFFRSLWAGGGAQEKISTVNTGDANSVVSQEYAGVLDLDLTRVDLDAYIYYIYGTFGNIDGSVVMIRRCKIGYTYNQI